MNRDLLNYAEAAHGANADEIEEMPAEFKAVYINRIMNKGELSLMLTEVDCKQADRITDLFEEFCRTTYNGLNTEKCAGELKSEIIKGAESLAANEWAKPLERKAFYDSQEVETSYYYEGE